MTAGVIITAEGEVTYRDIGDLADYQAIVGGSIEAVGLSDGSPMYVNEEGMVHGLPVNRLATLVCALGHRDVGVLRGHVVIVGPPDLHGVSADLTDHVRTLVSFAQEMAS
jgi:hypothetical protein